MVKEAKRHDEEDCKDAGQLILERRTLDPTYGLTAEEKAKLEKKKTAKPRPRDFFPVHEIIKKREQRIIDRIMREKEDKEERKRAKERDG